MTQKQHLIFWMGFLLILVRLMTTEQGAAIWSTVVSGAHPFSFSGGQASQDQKNGTAGVLGTKSTPLTRLGHDINKIFNAPFNGKVKFFAP